ncbi:hypothetical protein [uncultured Campylobacter sp.]|uniref:hypothetical protein n=1 Tax=uncultured Campylobacter sp. TaxID=218934 RepID=UPI00260665BF|nr:hypothetical protein [uncultured Campylobacter sp.]
MKFKRYCGLWRELTFKFYSKSPLEQSCKISFRVVATAREIFYIGRDLCVAACLDKASP